MALRSFFLPLLDFALLSHSYIALTRAPLSFVSFFSFLFPRLRLRPSLSLILFHLPFPIFFLFGFPLSVSPNLSLFLLPPHARTPQPASIRAPFFCGGTSLDRRLPSQAAVHAHPYPHTTHTQTFPDPTVADFYALFHALPLVHVFDPSFPVVFPIFRDGLWCDN